MAYCTLFEWAYRVLGFGVIFNLQKKITTKVGNKKNYLKTQNLCKKNQSVIKFPQSPKFVKKNQCVICLRYCCTFQVKPWSNFTVLNAWTSTHQNRRDIITQTAHTLEPDSHTCFSWYIRSTGQSDQQTSLYQGEIPEKDQNQSLQLTRPVSRLL